MSSRALASGGGLIAELPYALNRLTTIEAIGVQAEMFLYGGVTPARNTERPAPRRMVVMALPAGIG